MKNPQSDPPPKGGITVYIPPKLASVLLALVIGSGAGVFGGFKLVNGSGDESDSHNSDVEYRDQDYNVRFESIEQTQTEHTEKIGALETKTEQIQTVQVEDIARTEARRVTADIRNRSERERQYDRIRSLNERRLKSNKPPCENLNCWE